MTAWDDLRTARDDIRFWQQVAEDARRTIICSPELESRVKTRLAALGLSDLHDVRVSRFVPEDHLYVADLNAIEASNNQALARAMREWRFR